MLILPLVRLALAGMDSAPASVAWGQQKKEGPMFLGWKGTLETIRAGALEVLGCADLWMPTMGEGGTGRQEKSCGPLPWAHTTSERFFHLVAVPG